MNKSAGTVGRLLAAQAARLGERRALIFAATDTELSFREFDALSREVAKGLLASGVSRGDHVAVWAANIPEWLFILFGCAKIGAVAVPLNANCGVYELEYILRQSDAKALFWAGGRTEECLAALRGICSGDPVAADDARRFPELCRVVAVGEPLCPGMLGWKEFLAGAAVVDDAALAYCEKKVRPDDVFLIQYSSGTTGFPKGAMLTHAAYVAKAAVVADRKGHTANDVICVPVPFFSSFGFLAVLVAIAAGAATLVMERFLAREMIAAVERWRATAIYGTPTMFLAALELADLRSYDLSSLRAGGISGDYCSPELAEAVIMRLGLAEAGIHYGSTETLITIMPRPGDPLGKRTATVGQALPDTMVKIVDLRTGRGARPGEHGELCTKGASSMLGYYKAPELTAEIIGADGWLRSGDLAWIDSEGFCRITGRIKDVIIRGGENIYPAEIEEFLATLPQVLDAKVVGVPSAFYGEEIVAFVRLKPGQKASALELKRFCRRLISINKVPKRVFFIDKYPETASGKVQKSKLRETAAQLLECESRKI
ncbi:AMP-binding protein [Anaeroselena agilis]|uniref:AMP-binding protein n=1 Tax=Anaeroselena agilis TaxID=3063788 RepID=A0ABU3P146_9FIRM|nr:AMP-binding protein [Selenomonadales bacterium 4137-cl]